MDTHEQSCDATQATSGLEPVPRRAYRAPEVVELGDVRELTRGTGNTRNGDGKFARKH